MRNIFFCLLASLWLVPVWAAPTTTAAEDAARTERAMSPGSLPERVCWFAEQKYAEGARILRGDIWLECGPQNELEEYGSLVWRSSATVLPATRELNKGQVISVSQ
ncbi:DUF1496 domain-containing protein [Aeromonas sp. MdU4]|uniref:DUF1496 domain-containing protein n=1 Tax=Aeromonas sp. MdU4 TaxID=3342819 RepID=UPI0035BB1AF6